jgi:hypothetical protein
MHGGGGPSAGKPRAGSGTRNKECVGGGLGWGGAGKSSAGHVRVHGGLEWHAARQLRLRGQQPGKARALGRAAPARDSPASCCGDCGWAGVAGARRERQQRQRKRAGVHGTAAYPVQVLGQPAGAFRVVPTRHSGKAPHHCACVGGRGPRRQWGNCGEAGIAMSSRERTPTAKVGSSRRASKQITPRSCARQF